MMKYLFIKKVKLSLEQVLIPFLILSVLISNDINPQEDVVSSNKKPNIIFIMADDMGWADVGYKGLVNSDFYETPNIDRLAKDGMVFNRFYPSAANCAPSRASIITGMYHPRHHVYVPQGYSRGGDISKMRWKTPTHGADESFMEAFEASPNQVDPNFESLAEMLKRAGYISARLGKWHIGDDNQGFDMSSVEGTPNYITNFYGRGSSFNSDATVAERLTDTAIDFIHQNKSNPFFLYLNHWEPHGPLVAREDRIKYFAKKLGIYNSDDELNISIDYDPEEYNMLRKQSEHYNDAIYAAMIEQVDLSVGRVLAALKAFGIEKNTLVIFTSDNGGVSGVTSNKPLRAGKGTFYEGGIRTPFIVKWPGVIKAGSTSDIPVNGVDFMPTFAEIVSEPVSEEQPVDGESIVPILKGNEENFDKNRSMFFHFPLYLGPSGLGKGMDAVLPVYNGPENYWRSVPLSVIMKGDYKLIYYHEYDGSIELYNLSEDISEQNNLVNKEPEKANELQDELLQWINKVDAPIPHIPNPEFSP